MVVASPLCNGSTPFCVVAPPFVCLRLPLLYGSCAPLYIWGSPFLYAGGAPPPPCKSEAHPSCMVMVPTSFVCLRLSLLYVGVPPPHMYVFGAPSCLSVVPSSLYFSSLFSSPLPYTAFFYSKAPPLVWWWLPPPCLSFLYACGSPNHPALCV